MKLASCVNAKAQEKKDNIKRRDIGRCRRCQTSNRSYGGGTQNRYTNAGTMFLVTGYSYVLACKLASGSLFLIAITVLHSVVTPIEVDTVFNVFLLATRNIYLHYEVS